MLLKPKWYLDIKLEAFYQFSSNGNRKQWVLFYLESFLLISGISGFSFFVIEHIRKPGNHGKFSEAHFSRYEDYLSDFKRFSNHFVCSGKTIKVLLKIIKENLPLRLESGFSCY